MQFKRGRFWKLKLLVCCQRCAGLLMFVFYVKSVDSEDCTSCPGSIAVKGSDNSLSASRDDWEGTMTVSTRKMVVMRMMVVTVVMMLKGFDWMRVPAHTYTKAHKHTHTCTHSTTTAITLSHNSLLFYFSPITFHYFIINFKYLELFQCEIS